MTDAFPVPRARIKRIAHKLELGMFGVFLWDGTPRFVTLELPWKDNHPRESCIPALTYLCKRINSPKHGETFEITGVPGRSFIEFHGASTIADLLGCVGVGEFFHNFGNSLGGQGNAVGIANPWKGAAFSEFREITKEISLFTLVIEEFLTN